MPVVRRNLRGDMSVPSTWRLYKGRPAAKPAQQPKAAPPKPSTPPPEAPKPAEPAGTPGTGRAAA